MRTSVYFLPRAQAAKARTLGAEPRVIVPAVRITDRAKRAVDPFPPAPKLSAVEAERCFGVRQGGRL